MGREVRKVPKDWKHPKPESGNPVPLYDGYCKSVTRWKNETGLFLQEWCGEKPEQKDYMPDFPESERTHYQMYETCSEGTPISPVMETPEELAHWLADNGASSFGASTATYDEWLAMIKRGSSVSAVIDGGIFKSGVEAGI